MGHTNYELTNEQGEHDEQDTQVHKHHLTEIWGISYQAETDIVRSFYPKANINEAYRSWLEVVKEYPNATVQRQVIKNGKVVSVENQIPRGF